MKKYFKRNKYLFFYTFLLLIGIGFFSFTKLILGHGPQVIILWPNPEAAKANLQLYTFPFITINPPPPSTGSSQSGSPQGGSIFGGIGGLPDNACPLDDIKPAGSSCTCIDFNAIACPSAGQTINCPKNSSGVQGFSMPLGGSWYCVDVLGPGLVEPAPVPPSGCYAACIAKPVVYLYPTEPTLVNVAVEAPGDVIKSDPLYPDGGWKNVLADPDGSLLYKGKKYSELFYETSVNKEVNMPSEGIVIPNKDIERTLRDAIKKFGLNTKESGEFLDYWVPVLKDLKSPYIFFSILPKNEKLAVDRLIIAPEPSTRIELIAYFKPLQKPIKIAPLVLPQNPPVRIGFTEVEWGGTIDIK